MSRFELLETKVDKNTEHIISSEGKVNKNPASLKKRFPEDYK